MWLVGRNLRACDFTAVAWTYFNGRFQFSRTADSLPTFLQLLTFKLKIIQPVINLYIIYILFVMGSSAKKKLQNFLAWPKIAHRFAASGTTGCAKSVFGTAVCHTDLDWLPQGHRSSFLKTDRARKWWLRFSQNMLIVTWTVRQFCWFQRMN